MELKEMMSSILLTGAAAGGLVAGFVEAIKARIKDTVWAKSWMYLVLAILGSLAAVFVAQHYGENVFSLADKGVLFIVTLGASQGIYFVGMHKED